MCSLGRCSCVFSMITSVDVQPSPAPILSSVYLSVLSILIDWIKRVPTEHWQFTLVSASQMR